MIFTDYLTELASNYGLGVTFIDIDETIFKTFAKIYVMVGGKVARKLSNQEFNTYELKDGEDFDFREFRDAKMFRKTSIPIPQTINRIKRMLKSIGDRNKLSKIVFLTARASFDDKNEFLQTFRDNGIDIDKIYVERAGDDVKGTIANTKKQIVFKYLKSGLYRRVRLIDDDIKNVKTFMELENELPDSVINKVRKVNKIPDDEKFPAIEFYGLLVQADGSLKRIK